MELQQVAEEVAAEIVLRRVLDGHITALTPFGRR